MVWVWLLSRCFDTGAEPCERLDLATGAELSRKSIWPSEPNHLDGLTVTEAKPSRQLDCMSMKLTSLGELLRLRDKNLVKRVYVQETGRKGKENLTLSLISYFDKVVQPSYMYMLSVQIITGNALGLLGSA